MVSATDIERETKEDVHLKGFFNGGLDGWKWLVSPVWSQDRERYKVSVSRAGVRGSSRCVATRANFENVADIIAAHINKENSK